jgi:hypothetical protein
MIADVVFKNAYGADVCLTIHDVNDSDNWHFVTSSIDNQSYAINIFRESESMRCYVHYVYGADDIDHLKRFEPESFSIV